jgi:MoaA/NifB/PqqE/SkfB family radical SAM enzyme
MDWDLFVKIATELKKLGVQEIGPFLIGEPFVNPELLIKAVTFLKKDLEIPYVFLTSNASLAAPEHVEALMQAGLDSLKWSVNFADWDQFYAIAQRKAMLFANAEDNIRRAFKVRNSNPLYKTKLYASSIMLDENQRERMRPFLERAILPYVEQHYWLPFYSFNGKISNVSWISKDRDQKKPSRPQSWTIKDGKAVPDKVAAAAEKTNIYVPTKGCTGHLEEPLSPVPCWTLFTAAHIMSNGIVTACGTDATGSWGMGDLKTQSFMEIWHCEKFKQLRLSHLEDRVRGTICEKCIYGG